MIRIEQCETEKERACEDCEEAARCQYIGTSPLIFGDGSEVKCVVIRREEGSVTMLIPTVIEVSACKGKIEGYRVTVHRFRRGIRAWLWRLLG